MSSPIRILIAACMAGLLIPFFFAFAHQPHLVASTPATIPIENPASPQAFYGTLGGTPDLYSFTTDKPLRFHASLLIPDLARAKKDIFVIATDNDSRSIVFTLNGAIGPWNRSYEPLSGDWYLQGPSIDLDLPAGTYDMTVTSSDNAGKYVLSIGKPDALTIPEAIRSLAIIPRIKLSYFEKSFVETLLSPWAILVVVILCALALAFLLIARLFRRYAPSINPSSFRSALRRRP